MAGSWTHTFTGPANTAFEAGIVLSDGSVLLSDAGQATVFVVGQAATFFSTMRWWILKPDANGNYHTGTFTRVRDSYGAHLYFPNAVTNTGDFAALAGEFVGGFPQTPYELYRVRTGVWELLPPPEVSVGVLDSGGQVLNDGRIFVTGFGSAIFDPITCTWTTAAHEPANLDEASSVLLPNGAIPFTENFNPPAVTRYYDGTDTWYADANTTTDLIRTLTAEIGPWIRVPDGRCWLFGGNGHTNYHTPNANPTLAGAFAAGPDLPLDPLTGALMQINDGDGLLQVDGTIFLFAGPNGDTPPVGPGASFPPPAYTLVADPIGNTITRVADAPGGISANASFAVRTIMLPTGDILVFAGSDTFAIWNTGAGPNNAWRPTVTRYPKGIQGGQTYSLTGTQLNGIARSNSGGDDYWQNQLPLVRITHVASGTVTYCRSYKISTMAIATGGTPITMKFSVPLGIPIGPSTLEVVVNGIAVQTPLPTTVFPATRFGVSGIGVDPDHSVPANVSVAELQVARGALSWAADGPGPAVTQDTTTTRSGRTVQLAPQCSTVAQGGQTVIPSAPFSGGVVKGTSVFSLAGEGVGSGRPGGDYLGRGGRASPVGNSAGGTGNVVGGDGGKVQGAGGGGNVQGGTSFSASPAGSVNLTGGTNQPLTGNPGVVRVTANSEIILNALGPHAPVAPGFGKVAFWANSFNTPATAMVTEDDGTEITIGQTGVQLLAVLTAAGTTNVTIPAGVTRVWGFGRSGSSGGGGGGAGGGGQASAIGGTGGGGGGNGGAGTPATSEVWPPCAVTAGDILACTVGAKGTGGKGAGASAIDTDGGNGIAGKAGGQTTAVNLTTGKTLWKTANVARGGAAGQGGLSGTHGGTGGVVADVRGFWGRAGIGNTSVNITGFSGGNGGNGVNGSFGQSFASLNNNTFSGSDPFNPPPLLEWGGITAGNIQINGSNGGFGGAALGPFGGGGGGGGGSCSGPGDEFTLDGVTAPLPTDGVGGDGGTGGSAGGPVLPIAGANGTAGVNGRAGGGGGGGGGGACTVAGVGGAAAGDGADGTDGFLLLFGA